MRWCPPPLLSLDRVGRAPMLPACFCALFFFCLQSTSARLVTRAWSPRSPPHLCPVPPDHTTPNPTLTNQKSDEATYHERVAISYNSRCCFPHPRPPRTPRRALRGRGQTCSCGRRLPSFPPLALGARPLSSPSLGRRPARRPEQ